MMVQPINQSIRLRCHVCCKSYDVDEELERCPKCKSESIQIYKSEIQHPINSQVVAFKTKEKEVHEMAKIKKGSSTKKAKAKGGSKYSFTCTECNAVKKTNYQQFKKREADGTSKTYTCRECKKNSKDAKK